MKYFDRIEKAADIAPLLAELERESDAWELQTGRQDKGTVQRESVVIPIRGLRRSRIRGRRLRDVHETRYTALSRRFPAVVDFLQRFAAARNAKLGRARIVRLPPGAQVFDHVDRGEYYEVRDRFHLVLQSGPGSVLRSGGEEAELRPGELWWFDNKQVHSAANDSPVERIHLIFDLLPIGSERARSHDRVSERLDPDLLDLGKALDEARTTATSWEGELVRQGVRLYLAGRESPQRWKRALKTVGRGREDSAPFRAVAGLLAPAAGGTFQGRLARATAWALAHLELGDLRFEDIPDRIAKEGGLRAVARAWKRERPNQ